MTYLARPPRTTSAVVVELSQSLRAVVEGKTGAVTLIRSGTVFHLTDLEAAKLDHARAAFLRRETESP